MILHVLIIKKPEAEKSGFVTQQQSQGLKRMHHNFNNRHIFCKRVTQCHAVHSSGCLYVVGFNTCTQLCVRKISLCFITDPTRSCCKIRNMDNKQHGLNAEITDGATDACDQLALHLCAFGIKVIFQTIFSGCPLR